MQSLKFTPLIIIGAGRSGTNILRDTLVKAQGFSTWNCDEIDPIWHHGNLDIDSDQIASEKATDKVQSFIRKKFERVALASTTYVVEKTCANSLRVPFVNRILPESRFLFIYRDGYNVVPSALARWTAPIELKYLLRKFRYIPLSDIPFYLRRFLSIRSSQIFSNENVQGKWGPVYDGMYDDIEKLPLALVCAKQWSFCVQRSIEAFDDLNIDRVHSVSYSDLCDEPNQVMKGISKWLNIEWTEDEMQKMIRGIRRERKQVQIEDSPKEISDQLRVIIDPVNKRLDEQFSKVHKTSI